MSFSTLSVDQLKSLSPHQENQRTSLNHWFRWVAQ